MRFFSLLLILLHISPLSAYELLATADLTKLSIEELLEVEITEIATGKEQSVVNAPSVTTVITAEDIERMGAIELDEVLETVPGLHVARYHLGYLPIYTIRGIYSGNNSEVLVLINGISIKELYLGNRSVAWGGMPIKAISRIEVIRGPGSAMFGADAFAGVINIVTKTQADIEQTEVGFRFGSFNTQDAWLLHGDNYHGFNLALALEYRDTDGQREIVEADAQTYWDSVFKTNASLAPGSVELARQRFDARLDLSKDLWQFRAGYQGRKDVALGAGNAQALDSQGFFKADRFNTDLTYHNSEFATNWDVTAQISYLHNAFEPASNILFFPPGAFGGAYTQGYIANPGVSESNSRVTLSAFYSRFKQHLLRFGLGYHYGDLYEVTQTSNFEPLTNKPLPTLVNFTDTSYTFLPENARDDWFWFAQDVWKIAADWELTAGLRYDNYSDFGQTWNPRLALVWSTTEKLTTKFLYGRAFRAPTFYELYAINNPVKLGNADLDPETIETFELAFNYQVLENLYGALNVYHYQIHDKIDYVPTAGVSTIKAQNLGTRKGHGVELEARWQPFSDLNLLGNYAFQQVTDEEQDHDAGNAPQQQIYLRGDWLFATDWHVNTQLNWVGERERAFNDPREPVADYTWLDMTLNYQPSDSGWGLTTGIRNLLDSEAREPSLGPDARGVVNIPYDLPLARRYYFLELNFQFN